MNGKDGLIFLEKKISANKCQEIDKLKAKLNCKKKPSFSVRAYFCK